MFPLSRRSLLVSAASVATGTVLGRMSWPVHPPVRIAYAGRGSVLSVRVSPAGSSCRVLGPSGTTVHSWRSGTGFRSVDTAGASRGVYTVRVAGSTARSSFTLPLNEGSFDPPIPDPISVDRGPWSAATTYAVGDVVYDTGWTWLATRSSVGVRPGGAPPRWTAVRPS